MKTTTMFKLSSDRNQAKDMNTRPPKPDTHPPTRSLAVDGFLTQIDGLDKDGTRALRQTFKVSAKMPEDNKHGGGPVGMVAKVFRVTNAPSSVSKMDQGDDGAGAGDKLVVVLRRKRGDYYR